MWTQREGVDLVLGFVIDPRVDDILGEDVAAEQELVVARALEPGDVIATGTPAGVGFSRTPPVFMKPGDVVEIDLEGVGTLRNRVARE